VRPADPGRMMQLPFGWENEAVRYQSFGVFADG
jgi:hypothetical protein